MPNPIELLGERQVLYDLETMRKYAGFFRRAVASAIDALLLTLVSSGIQIVGMLAYFGFRRVFSPRIPFPDFWGAFDSLEMQFVNFALYIACALVYYGYGHARYGTTLGKKVFGIFVITERSFGLTEPEFPSLTRSLGRTAAYAVSYLPLGTGFLMALFHPRKKTLHEIISGTVSVRRERIPQTRSAD